MKQPSYLWKSRHGIYYFRVVQSKAAQSSSPGICREYKKSLNTRCPKEAILRSRLVWTQFLSKQIPVRHESIHQQSERFLSIQAIDTPTEYPRNFDLDWAPSSSKMIEYSSPHQTKAIGCLISDVVKIYAADRKSANLWRRKTEHENLAIYALLIRLLGDIPFNKVGRTELVHFKEVISRLPSNLNKNPKYRGKTLTSILNMTDLEPMSTTSLNKYISRIRALFSWAEANGFTDRNYANDLKIKVKQHQRDGRDAFKSSDLELLLKGDVYCAGIKPQHNRFWLPLLGMYTGARLEELCQLLVKDIVTIDDIYCISINDEEDKRLKNCSSRRIIPIHSKLIELGFLSYIEILKTSSSPRLFMELKRRRDGYGHNPSKWFANYRKKCGIVDGKKSFHSFRHSAASSLKENEAPIEQAQALLGHSTKSITFERYGKQYSISTLKRTIERISYPIDLSHLLCSTNNSYLSLDL